jgi:carbon-monoxide dehydrogenase medium subunit
MQDFDYISARSVDEVVALLSSNGGGRRVLAGGTDLLVQMRERHVKASLLVDIKHIPEVNELTYNPKTGLHLGAAVPCYRICQEAVIAKVYPGFVEAVALIGGTQIQGRASVGGNLCNASPAADSVPALIVHRATCLIAGPKGTRYVPAEYFCTAPGQTILEKGEFLVALHLPPPEPGFGAAYLRFTPRNEMDIAILDVSASAHMPDVLEMPYRPAVINAGMPDEHAHTYRLAGPTCLAGDVIGDYSFHAPLEIGSRVVFTDMAHYSMVKTTMFNGVKHPDIAIERVTGAIDVIREFTYDDYKRRMA